MTKRVTLLLTAMLLGIASLSARPALKKPVDVKQPDGTVVTLLLHGDEYLSFSTTLDGYTVLRCEDGFYRYADRGADGLLKATAVVARNREARTAEETAFLSARAKMVHQEMSASRREMKERAAQMASPLYGEATTGRRSPGAIWTHINYNNFKVLVVLVNWNDCQFTMANPQEFYQNLISEKNYTDNSHTHYPVDVNGSARDYFYDNSMGIFDPTFDVVGPVDVNYSCKYPHPKNDNGSDDNSFVSRFNTIIKDVMNALNPTVNFADYDLNSDGYIDMVYFIFAGYGSYVPGNDGGYIWPHANDYTGVGTWWSGLSTYDGKKFGRYACSVELQDYESLKAQHQNLDGIGTICHEFSHVLGLADHYDTDYADHGQSNDPGEFDVMANGSDFNDGLTPVGYNAFERHVLAFVEPSVLTEAGSYQLEPFATSNQALILKTGSTDDDFYLENRQKTGWDRFLPGHGLLVWRADTSNPSVWRSNNVNINPDHNYFVMVTTAPNNGKLVDLTSATVPALLSWAGKPAVQDLYDIAEEDGIVTFTAGKDLYQSVIEDFEQSPLSESGATGVKGVYCMWDLANASIEPKDGTNVAKLLRSGTLTSSEFEKGVRSLIFTVQNGAQKVKLGLKVSTDGGAFSYVKNADGKTQVDIAKNDAQTFIYRNIPANSKIQFAMLSTNNSAECFLDNIVATFPDNEIPTGIENVNVNGNVNGNGNCYNLAGQRVGAGYKGLVVKNGRKYIYK